MVGIFSTEVGLLYGGGIKQFLVQLAGVASTFIWTVITVFILFTIIKLTVGLRVSEEEEIEGLDVTEHGAIAYGDFVIKTQEVK